MPTFFRKKILKFSFKPFIFVKKIFFMSKFRYFKHIDGNKVATQSKLTDELNEYVDISGEEFFEVQVEIGGKMNTKIRKCQPNEWEEISNNEFNTLITSL
jgi:hypothetical protein